MNALPPRELLDTLRTAVAARLGEDHPDTGFVIELCADAIAFSWTLGRNLPDGHAGQRARTSSALMLELAFPEMRPGLRRQLSVACEIIAMGVRRAD